MEIKEGEPKRNGEGGRERNKKKRRGIKKKGEDIRENSWEGGEKITIKKKEEETEERRLEGRERYNMKGH